MLIDVSEADKRFLDLSGNSFFLFFFEKVY